VSRWNRRIGGREDTDIGSITEPERKITMSGTAFTFRRVMDLSDETKFKYSEVDIESQKLRLLLKEVIRDYPGQSWEGEIINMRGPFTPLVHNWDELDREADLKDDSRNREAREDLRKLLDYVASSSELEAYFKTRDSNLLSKSTTYQTMWTLFRPGTRIIASPFMNQPQIFEVKTSPDPWEDSWEDRNLSVACWCHDWNGKDMVKTTFDFPIEKFRGTKEINSLFCYPVEYYKDENGKGFDESLMKDCIKIGEEFERLCTVKKGAGQMFQYDGLALSSRGSITRAPLGDQVRMLFDLIVLYLTFHFRPGGY
jgi:hypothetical protein